MNKYYRIAAIYPSLVAVSVCMIYSVVDNYGYNSEWLTEDAVNAMSLATAAIYSMILCVFCLTIFLNKLQRIRESKILNLLSWFLLPLGCIVTVFTHEIWFSLKYDYKIDGRFNYVLIFNLPFLIGLVWSYLKYRKDTRHKKYQI